MALFSPPEVIFRPIVRTLTSSRICHVPILLECSGGSRYYQAAVCSKIGQPLEIKKFPLPEVIPDGKILLAIHACGINFADILSVKGQYQVRHKPPFCPGVEFAGRIEGVGSGVQRFKKGDRVIVLPVDFTGGGQAEYCIVDPLWILPAPDKMSFVDIAATIVSYSTSMMALSHTAQLKTGETVLVTAAAGATGLATVDIALNIFNAKVIALCGGPKKCEFLKLRGATHTIDYHSEKIQQRVKEITSGRGVDVVVDQVGGEVFIECLKSTSFEGRVITVGYASGEIPKIPANLLLLKSCSVRGVFWGNYAVSHPQAFHQSITEVLKGCSEGRLHPYVGKIYSLAEINTAFDYVSNRQSMGKVVIKMRDELQL